VTQTAAKPQGERIFKGNLYRVRNGNGWAFTEKAPAPPPKSVRRPARIAQTLALAHRLEAAIARGEYRDRADVARQLGFTRARVTQILDLLQLAPDIQEEIVFLEAVDRVEPLSERGLRGVIRCQSWAEQRTAWSKLGADLPHDRGPANSPIPACLGSNPHKHG